MISMEPMGISQPIAVKKGSQNVHVIAMKDSTQ